MAKLKVEAQGTTKIKLNSIGVKALDIEAKMDKIETDIKQMKDELELLTQKREEVLKGVFEIVEADESCKPYKNKDGDMEYPNVITDIYRFKISKSNEVVYKGEAEDLPKRYQKTPILVNKALLRSDYNSGLAIPETVLIRPTQSVKCEQI